MDEQPHCADATVFIVEDDDAMRRALHYLFQNVGIASRMFASAEEFERDYRGEPGCITLDLALPGQSGHDVQEWLKSQQMITPTIMISGHGSIAAASRAFRNGAVDFIEKPFRGDELLRRTTTAIAQDRENREKQARQAQLRERLARLSDREREVLALVAAGKPNKQIAQELGITSRTVEFHRAGIIEKLDVKSSAGIVRLWALHEALPSDDELTQ